MYNNIGKKIKGLAIILWLLEATAAEFVGMLLLVKGIDYAEELIPIALLLMLLAPVVTWILSCFLYGYGELIDKTCDIARNTAGGKSESNTQETADFQRIRQLENLRAQGLITEQEYQQVISKHQ